LQTEF